MLIRRDVVFEEIVRVLCRHDVPPKHALLQAELLVEAELAGHPSHGLLRLPTIVGRIESGVCDPSATGVHTWPSPGILRVDGQGGLGPVIARRAVDSALERVSDQGVVAVLLSRTNHLGMLAWYVERIARQGRLSIAMCTSEALVHAWGGRTAALGTNPIAVGIPAQPHPFVYDSATSAISMGQVHDLARRGKQLQPGWALDERGEATLDPTAAITGSIAPFGGPKGYGLGLAVELLIAAVTGTALGADVHGTLDTDQPSTKGDVFILFDAVNDERTDAISAYLNALRQSEPQAGFTSVRVPGDGSRERRAQASRDGIDFAQSLWRDIEAL
jgi:L-2-hydroxycarboxylate dehydrogenase (NAD+)